MQRHLRIPAALAALDALALVAEAPTARGSGGVQLAPALSPDGAAKDAPPPESVVEDRAWKFCRVRLDLLVATAGSNRIAAHEEKLVALGENFDLHAEVPLGSGERNALVRFDARLRASLARSPGVLYHVTTDAVLVSAIGFQSSDVGRDQVRQAFMDIADQSTHLQEAWVSPELTARIVLAVQVSPVFGREDDPLAALRAPTADMQGFRVEAYLKEKDAMTLLDQASLSATPGHDVGFSLSRFGVDTPGVHPALRLGSPLTVVEPVRAADSGYLATHEVAQRDADTKFLQANTIVPDDAYMLANEVDRKPVAVQPAYKKANNKLSPKKRKALEDRQHVQAVHDWVVERSKHLPSGDAVPEGFGREELSLHLMLLNATESTVQVEVRVDGHLKLPHEEEYTSLTRTFVEAMPRGEPFDIAISELVRDKAADSDYVLRVTPQQ